MCGHTGKVIRHEDNMEIVKTADFREQKSFFIPLAEGLYPQISNMGPNFSPCVFSVLQIKTLHPRLLTFMTVCDSKFESFQANLLPRCQTWPF